MTATVDMPALIAWALSQDPPACWEGIKRARRGWGHLTVVDREWLAERCGPELLEVLSRDPHYSVRMVVTWRCSPELLEVLSRDPDSRVRMAVQARITVSCAHSHTPSCGYVPCACRDCMEIAVGNDMGAPALCWACREAGCEASDFGADRYTPNLECRVEPELEEESS